MKIAITGHRPNKLGFDYDFTTPLMHSIKNRIIQVLDEKKPTKVISGLAIGIDQLFVLIAIEKNIPFIAAIPCFGQEKVWPKKSQDLYRKILSNSLCTIHRCYDDSFGHYTKTCMQNRNIWMADNCDLLIAVWDGSHGGTYNCIQYAKSINRDIIYIDPQKACF